MRDSLDDVVCMFVRIVCNILLFYLQVETHLVVSVGDESYLGMFRLF